METAYWMVNGYVLDSKNGKWLKNTDVKVVDGMITELGKKKEDGLPEIDMSGKFLTPGLMDMHTHMVWDGTSATPVPDMVEEGAVISGIRAIMNLQECLKKGVTTVRDVGCNDDITISLSKAIRMGLTWGADIIPCGSSIMGTYGHVPEIGTLADTKDELIKAIREKKMLHTKAGNPCQWIKIMATGGAAGPEEVGPSMYSLSDLELIVSEAHRLHMKVCAHALSKEGIENCILAGIDTIEHGADISDEMLDIMKEKGLAYTPTLSVYRVLAESEGIVNAFTVGKAKKVVEHQKSTFLRAIKKGVKIALGTDAGSPNFGPHPNVFMEMLDMEAYGMERADVIRSATLTAAEVLGIDKKTGSLEKGKAADILVLTADPMKDLHVFTDNLESVYKMGKKVE